MDVTPREECRARPRLVFRFCERREAARLCTFCKRPSGQCVVFVNAIAFPPVSCDAGDGPVWRCARRLPLCVAAPSHGTRSARHDRRRPHPTQGALQQRRGLRAGEQSCRALGSRPSPKPRARGTGRSRFGCGPGGASRSDVAVPPAGVDRAGGRLRDTPGEHQTEQLGHAGPDQHRADPGHATRDRLRHAARPRRPRRADHDRQGAASAGERGAAGSHHEHQDRHGQARQAPTYGHHRRRTGRRRHRPKAVGRVSRLGRPDRAAVDRAVQQRRGRVGQSAVGQGDGGDHRPVPDPDPAARVPVLAVHAHGRRRGGRAGRLLGVHRQRPEEGQGHARQDHVRGRRGRGRGAG